jgi:hypothetical protein
MSMDIAKFCDSYQEGVDKQSENMRVVATASYTRNPVATITMTFFVAFPPTLDDNTSLVVLLMLKRCYIICHALVSPSWTNRDSE